jgi:exodeoxyribonuclease V beta subunit
MGGAVYMFLRGIHAEGAGVHLQRPPQALIEALDSLFTGNPDTYCSQ